MKNRVYGRKRFLASASLVGLLSVLPATGWIVRQQFRLVGGQPIPGMSNLLTGYDAHPAKPDVSAHHAARPDDFDGQVALALETPRKSDEKPTDGIHSPVIHALLTVRRNFDDRPELQAHILRYLTTGDLKLSRGVDERLIESAKTQAEMAKADHDNPVVPPTPVALALAEATARRGRTLAPGNAYFDTMYALALFADHRDTEALAALDTAATKTQWNDYAFEDVRSRVHLLEENEGRAGAIPRLAIQASVLFPHYARLREMARLTTCLAVRREMAGDAAGGFRIRRATAHVGALMRSDSRTLIGNLVGMAITQIASQRPGGAPLLARRDDDRDQAERVTRYVAYLTQIGHPEEARWYLAEREAGDKMRFISQAAWATNDYGLLPAIYLAAWWAGGLLLLMAAAWTLLYGGAASLLTRREANRESRFTLRRPGLFVAIGLLGYLATIITSWVTTNDADAQTVTAVATLLAVAVLAFPILRLNRGNGWRYAAWEVGKGIWVISATVAIGGGVWAIASLSCAGLDTFRSALMVFNACLSDGTANPSGDWGSKAIEGAAVLLIPSIALLVLAIRSRIRRIPLRVGGPRGMRALALPLSAILLTTYAITLVGTAVQERNVRANEDAMLTHEGRFAAAQVSQEWPAETTLDRPAPPTTDTAKRSTP